MKVTLHGTSKDKVAAAEDILRRDPTPEGRMYVLAIYGVAITLGSEASAAHANARAFRVHKTVTL